MHTKKKISIVEQVNKIHTAAQQTDDGQRCMIAPSPQLKRKMDAELKRLQNTASRGLLAGKIGLRIPKPVGFNDGLIYPGDTFPAGTPAAIARSAAVQRAPLRGTVRVIVVLVDFSDKPMKATKAHFEDLFFSTGKVATGSLREYYKEVTHGLVDIQGQVVGPYRMPQKLSQYANGESGTGSAAPNARTMARDAALASNPAVDYSVYDNDGDGFVDAYVVIHAGTGGEVTGSGNDIWSHKWVLSGGAYTADGNTKIYGYLTVPEDCKLGVCAHELGHLLFGFPDLYDVDNSSEGIGDWCLMAAGSWGNNGLTPAHPSAWCKCQQGWVSLVNQTTNKTKVAIEDVKSGYKVHRLFKNGTGTNEYFLVENRQQVKFDKSLPNGGLLIWHIDDAAPDNTNETHYKVALVQADGKKDLELARNRGDGGDCYPGTAKNKKFDDTTTPNSRSYGGAATGVAVTNISAAAATMYADLAVKLAAVKKPATKKARPKKKKAASKTK
jgi:immune inhibitor A